MPHPRLALPALGLLAALAACRSTDGDAASVDAGGPGDPDASRYPAPRADLVPAVGSDDTLDIATWNIENFPATADTPRIVADLVTSLDLDLIAVEEIASVEAWDELVARLPGHAGLLSSHTYGDGTYQKVGFLFRESLVDLAGGALLFGSQGFDFPRPPLQVQVTIDGKTVTAIVMHLKAGVDDESRARRTAAIALLEPHLRDLADGGDDVIVLGDWNQSRTTAQDDDVWAPILSAPDRYQVLTQGAADGGEVSYLPFGGKLIDHAVATTGFELGAASVVVPRLDQQPIDYTDQVSDHLPVVVSFPR